MGCLYVDRDASGAGRVSDAVVQRMRDSAAGRLPGARPLLLFPEGTTTNGRFLLPFKTGAFLAGLPVRPVVIRYGEVRLGAGRWRLPARGRAVRGAGRLAGTRLAGLAHATQSAERWTPALPPRPQGRFSPCWEMIPAARHIFLCMANPVRRRGCSGPEWQRGQRGQRGRAAAQELLAWVCVDAGAPARRRGCSRATARPRRKRITAHTPSPGAQRDLLRAAGVPAQRRGARRPKALRRQRAQAHGERRPLARAEQAAEVARGCGSGGGCGRRARRHPWLAWRAPLWVGGEPQLAAFRPRPAQHSLSRVSLLLPTLPTRRAPGQLDFAGLQPTAATYHDKMDLMKRLKAEHGLE